MQGIEVRVTKKLIPWYTPNLNLKLREGQIISEAERNRNRKSVSQSICYHFVLFLQHIIRVCFYYNSSTSNKLNSLNSLHISKQVPMGYNDLSDILLQSIVQEEVVPERDCLREGLSLYF